nr:NB-ARC domains-containing protein [Tanacetum cinerariifolium]
MKAEKVLIILDDVWEILDLEKLCIPCGINHMNCKILLTSRSELVCERMGAHRICVNALPKEEAWILFKLIVGDGVETNADLQDVAQEVVKECGGLPLFLKAVGNALKTKGIQDWKKALKRLQDPAPALSVMDPEIREAFTRLELSYDFLENEVQSCFLLCCMFPEDEKILLEMLVYYAVGLAKFDRLKSMEDARERVEDAVKTLTSSGLLLNLEDKRYTRMHDVVRDVALIIASKESIDDARWRVRLAVEILTSSGLLLKLEDERYTKMHDVVRDVARIIASVGENNFLVKAGKGLTEWLPRNELKSYTGISLMRNKIPKLPNYDLDLPHLEIFLASYNCNMTTFSSKLFQGMQEVKVLDMGYCNQNYVIPEGFDFGKLKRFGIQIGVFGHWSSHLDCRLAIVAVDVGTSLLEWTKKLILKRPATILSYIENIKNIMPDLSRGGFNEFEHIELISCPNVSSLVDEADVSVAKGLGNLQNLSIVDCENFKKVIWDGDDRINEAEIVFPSLTKITLLRLNKLERFSGNSSIKYPSLVDVSIMYCPSMKTWGLGPGRHEAPKLEFVGKMPLDGPDATINDIVRKIARNG